MSAPQEILQFIWNEARPAGLNVLRIAQDGSKRPDPPQWKPWQTEPQPDALLQCWFSRPQHCGVGVVCGYGEVECLDFDDAKTFVTFMDTAEAIGLAVVRDIADGWSERTPSGGAHLIYRTTALEPNQPLARRPDPEHPRGGKAIIETRGGGGQVVVSPSSGTTHASRLPYVRSSGGPRTMRRISPAARRDVFNLARSLDEMPEREFDPPNVEGRQDVPGDRPGDVYNATFTREAWNKRLTADGWRYVHSHNAIDYYCRPGKTSGISASVNWDGRCRLRVFTTSTILEPGMYSPFAYIAHWHHAGNWRDAGKALFREGFGKRKSATITLAKPDLRFINGRWVS